MEIKDIVAGIPLTDEAAVVLQEKVRVNEVFNHIDDIFEWFAMTPEQQDDVFKEVAEHCCALQRIFNRFLVDAIEEIVGKDKFSK